VAVLPHVAVGRLPGALLPRGGVAEAGRHSEGNNAQERQGQVSEDLPWISLGNKTMSACPSQTSHQAK
jgi:hypothetical protein